MLRHRSGLGQDALAIRFGQWTDPSAGVKASAAFQNDTGRAVDESPEFTVRHPADNRAALSVGVERDFMLLRQFLFYACAFAARFAAGSQ